MTVEILKELHAIDETIVHVTLKKSCFEISAVRASGVSSGSTILPKEVVGTDD